MFESYPFTEADAKSDRFNCILAWLLVQGAPEGKLSTVENHLPGHGTVTEHQVVFFRDGFSVLDVNAGLLLRGPSLVLTDLQVHFRFGNPAEATHFDYIREVPQPGPTPTPLPPQPENPLRLMEEERDRALARLADWEALLHAVPEGAEGPADVARWIREQHQRYVTYEVIEHLAIGMRRAREGQ